MNIKLSKVLYEWQLSYTKVVFSFVHKPFCGFFFFGMYECGVFPACENWWFTRHLSGVNRI